MSENSFMSKETDQNGLPTKDKTEGEATLALQINLSVEDCSKLGENTHDTIKKDSDSKDRSRSRKDRSRSRSRHRSRDRRGSRSRDRRRSRRRSHSREHKWKSTDKKNKIVDSKSPSPGKNSKHKHYESESNRKRRRSRERDQRYTRSPDVKHGNNSDRNFEDSRSRYSDRRTRFSDNRSTTRDRRNEDKQFNNNNSWGRGLNRNNWDDKSQHPTNTFEDVIKKSVQKISKDVDDGSHFHNDNPSNSSIPVLLSSNCKPNNPAFAALNTNMVQPSMQPGADGRFAPPLMAVPTTNFKDGLPNVREPPPGFLPFRHNNPIRLQAEPTFALLDQTRLPVRNAEPQQVLLQPLQMIRTPSKMEMPMDLRFLSPDLRLPLYSTGIVNRQQTNLITRVPLDQAQVMHQVQPRLVGISQVTDIPPPPPPPQTFTITQTQSMPPNTQFPASGVQRLTENVSFVSNPPPQLIYGSLGSRPGFITNITVNEPLQPRIPSSHPPPQMILTDLKSHICSTAVHMQKSGMTALLPAHSTADITDLKASASKNNKSKVRNTGSEKYSPYSCSSEGSSNDAYSDGLFEDPFNDIGTPLEEESNSVDPQGSPKHLTGLPHKETTPLQDVNHKVDDKSNKGKDTLVHPFVDISGIAKKFDLTNTLNMIQVNDLKKVLETANSVAKVKQNETSDAKLLKAHKIEQIAEEVKIALKPHFSKNLITKDEYKDIMRRAVPKIFGSRSSLDSKRIQAFVQEYVNKIIKSRKPGKVKNTTAHGANHDKKQSSKIPSKA